MLLHPRGTLHERAEWTKELEIDVGFDENQLEDEFETALEEVVVVEVD